MFYFMYPVRVAGVAAVFQTGIFTASGILVALKSFI